MATEGALSFTPKWYAVGDPDIPTIAIAYGAIALSSIWLLESIAHRLMFVTRKDISLSHVAALVAFKGSSWSDIFCWLSWHLWPWQTGSRVHDQRLNRRVICAILFRIFLLLIEVAVLFMSVPRSIPVFEDQVGSSEITFLRNQSSGNPDQGNARTRTSACKQDPLPYTGFAPSAIRQICLSGTTRPVKSRRVNLEADFPNGTEIYILWQDGQSHTLVFLSLRTQLFFTLRHAIRLDPAIGQSLTLALPNRTDENAISSIMAMPKFRNICSNTTTGNQSPVSHFLICIPSSTEAIRAADEIPLYLLEMVSTRRTSAVLEKGKVINVSIPLRSFPQVGTMSRPRVGIYPALIMLSLLIAINWITTLAIVDEDILFHMFQLSSEAVGATSTGNPFHAEHITFENSRE